MVTPPRLYLFNRESNTQVLEDCLGYIDLKSIIGTPRKNEIVAPQVAVSIGRRLGSWLRSFHTWADDPAQRKLRDVIGDGEPIRRLKYSVGYASFIKVLENFPDLLEDCRDTLKEVEAAATKELEMPPDGREGRYQGIVHRDFWTGK
jgi:hypothetical protein